MAGQEWVIDIDGTLLVSHTETCPTCKRVKYVLIGANRDMVAKVNAKYDLGDRVVLWTGRGWDCYDLTVKQLKRVGVKYHELVMGKPLGTYVDADARRDL